MGYLPPPPPGSPGFDRWAEQQRRDLLFRGVCIALGSVAMLVFLVLWAVSS